MNNNSKGKVLIIDDEPNAIKVLSAILAQDGYEVIEARHAHAAIKIIDDEGIDTVITDVRMPDMDGQQVFEYIAKNHPDIPLIFLTAYGTVESAVHAITQGAFYYFIKPPDYQKLKSIISRAVEQQKLKKEVLFLRKKLQENSCHHRITGNSEEMVKLLETIETIKDSSVSVLICGETGTGKELIAKALHETGARREKPFIAVNCAAIPKDLLEAELFGFEKGAFSGAVCRKPGKFEEASGGTLFLDEIGELDHAMQAKLLRVLQERELEHLGSNKKITVNFRLLSSTNRDLQEEIKKGNFREDLFYRLNVVQINMPPLRDRKDDIPFLAHEFVKEFCAREKKTLTISDKVMKIFKTYSWPGNVRQLKNTVERAIVLAKGNSITTKELNGDFMDFGQTDKQIFLFKTLSESEAQSIKDALFKCDGNKSQVAKLLGISRKALYKRLREYQLM